MMQVRIRLFAMARDLAGTDEMMLSLPSRSVAGDVIDILLRDFPAFVKWKPHLRLAVNHEYVPLTFSLHEDDEVAVIPPVSGG